MLQFSRSSPPTYKEIFNMTRLTPTSGLDLAETAMMMLKSEEIMRMMTCCGPESDAALAEVAQSNVKVEDTNLSSDILIEDWNALFRSITARLSACVGERLAQMPDLQPHDLAQVRAVVLECVEAMSQLQLALTRERLQRRLPVMELMGEHTALIQAIAKVAGSAACSSLSGNFEAR